MITDKYGLDDCYEICELLYDQNWQPAFVTYHISDQIKPWADFTLHNNSVK